MRNDPKVERLAAQPLLKGVTARELARLTKLFDEVQVPAGDTLMSQGRSGGEVFIIDEGTVSVRIGDREVAILGAGEIVGEVAVLDHQPRSATVVALSDLRVLVLTPDAFRTLASEPAVALRLLRSAAARLRGAEVAR